MFFGDSITEGESSDSSLNYGGYRGFFQILMQDAGLTNFVAVGPYTSHGPFGANLYPNHLGAGGHGFVGTYLGDILPNDWKNKGSSYEPDLVLLQGGSNDMSLGVSIPDSIAAAQKLIGQIFADRPDARIVMGNIHKIFTPNVSDEMVREYNGSWYALYRSFLASGANIYHADLYGEIETLIAKNGSVVGVLDPGGVHPVKTATTRWPTPISAPA